MKNNQSFSFHKKVEGCGKGIKNERSNDNVREIIYVHGCMEIIKDKLEDDVVPMMVGYAGLGVVLAIIELICVVLACAYIAQIRRSNSTNDFLST